jgi:gluconokinase
VTALDIGSSSTRAVDEDGAVVGRVEYERVPAADDLLAICRRLAPEPAAVSCFWHSLVALDTRGRPLTPVLTWRDLEPAAALPLESAAVHARTGCPLHPSFWPMRIAGLRREGVRAARFVSFPDLLFDGRTSLSIASGTGLLGLDGRWDEELLDVLGLEAEQLPELAAVPVWGDGACANVGSAAVGSGLAAVTIGTSGAFRTVHEPSEPRPGLFLYRVDGQRVCEGGSLSDGGSLLDWLGGLLGEVDTRGLADEPPSGLDFLALLGGERSPGWKADARGAVAGLSLSTTSRDLVRAAMEGVALRFAEVAELMPEVEAAIASGGALLRNPDWAQILSDVLELPVTLPGVEEASARGALVLAGAQTGAAPLGERFQPRPEHVEAYRAARQRQRVLYETLT